MSAWLPVLEENQGTLSLGAIVIALTVALWEQRTARVREAREAKMERIDALALITHLREVLDLMIMPRLQREGVAAAERELQQFAAKARSPVLARHLTTLATNASEAAAADDENFEMRYGVFLDGMRLVSRGLLDDGRKDDEVERANARASRVEFRKQQKRAGAEPVVQETRRRGR